MALSDPGPVTAADLPAAVGATDDAGVALVERALRLAVVGTLVYPDADATPPTPRSCPRPGSPRSSARTPRAWRRATRESAAGPPRNRSTSTTCRRSSRPHPPAHARCSTRCCGVRRSASRRPTAPRRPRPSTGSLRRHLLLPGDSRHVVLPRAVALALRGGRTHTAPAFPPPLPDRLPHRSHELVAAESAAAGERIVLLVARLVRLWEQAPPGVLRGGGLGVRELRRVASTLETDEAEAAFVIELAGAAAFVADDGEDNPVVRARRSRSTSGPSATCRTAGPPWRARGGRPCARRGSSAAATTAAGCARPWTPSCSAPGLRGCAGPCSTCSRTPRRGPPWTPRTSSPCCAGGPRGRCRRPPRSTRCSSRPAAWASSARARCPTRAAPCSWRRRRWSAPADPADALAAALPPAVDEILLQGDLTGVVPGRPSPELEDLLDRTAHVESRGGALTVRFTPESVRRALDAGATADGLLAELAALLPRGRCRSRCEYLVRDAARRHGRLRVGSASGYVRADDPSLLAGLVEDPRLASLGLVRLAPTVLAAQAPARELVEALRAHGLAPVAEGPDGQVVHVASSIRRVGRRATAGARRRATDAAPTSAAGDPHRRPPARPGPAAAAGGGGAQGRRGGAGPGHDPAHAGPTRARRADARRRRAREQPTPSTRWCSCVRRPPRRPRCGSSWSAPTASRSGGCCDPCGSRAAGCGPSTPLGSPS